MKTNTELLSMIAELRLRAAQNYSADIESAIEDLPEDNAVLLADGLESAFIGIGYQFNTPIAVYSRNRVLKHFENEGMSPEDAIEYYEFNVAGSYVGESTPIFLNDIE